VRRFTGRWDVQDGDWRAVVMATDASRGVDARVTAGAEVRALLGISLGLAGAGLVLLALGGVVLALAVRSRKP
jgi:hypothetical protein